MTIETSLVRYIDTRQPMTVEPLTTFAARAWFAYHCLPRDQDGKPPASTALEAANGLNRGKLGKIFRDGAPQIPIKTLRSAAAALGVAPEWLESGEGPPPTLSGPLPPRPGTFSGAAAEILPVLCRSLPNWEESAAIALKSHPRLARYIERAGDIALPHELRPIGVVTPAKVLRIARLIRDAEIREEELQAHTARIQRDSSTMPTVRK